MTSSALFFMLAVWTIVLGMVGYCYSKILRSKNRFEPGEDSDSDASLGDSDEGQ